MVGYPLVSVCIPFLNAEKFIEETINSVFAQTYQNWELLLVDDGSTDNSTKIAKDYVIKYPDKIFYLEHEGHQNKGIATTRNVGIANAKGELIAFLDSDDVWFPDKLKRQVEIMEKHPDIGLVFNRSISLYEDGSKNPQPITTSPGKHPIGVLIHKILENGHNHPETSSVLVRKELIVKIGGFDESFRPLYEDSILWITINLYSPIYYDPEYTSLYRIYSNSTSNTAPTKEEYLIVERHYYLWLMIILLTKEPDNYVKDMLTVSTRLTEVLLRSLINEKDFQKALSLLKLIEKKGLGNLNNAECNYFTAFCLHNLQINLQEALDRYDRALEYGFDEFWVRFNRGSLHAQIGNIKQAKADLIRATEINPNHEGAQEVLRQLH